MGPSQYFWSWAAEESRPDGSCSSNLGSLFAGTFCGDLERRLVSGKTIPLELMVLISEMRELQVLRGVFQNVRTKFIDGL